MTKRLFSLVFVGLAIIAIALSPTVNAGDPPDASWVDDMYMLNWNCPGAMDCVTYNCVLYAVIDCGGWVEDWQ